MVQCQVKDSKRVKAELKKFISDVILIGGKIESSKACGSRKSYQKAYSKLSKMLRPTNTALNFGKSRFRAFSCKEGSEKLSSALFFSQIFTKARM